ncbi:MAG: helix-turn-helix transcriptional regulator [Prolixibacteraceae bacterium]
MNNDFQQKLQSIVEANLANENFGVEDLVRESGMSHSNLHRKLRASSNQSISQFIREVRLIKARELLQRNDLTISEISYQVGFGSPTYFNKCFHEYFGHSPGEYKNHKLNRSGKFSLSRHFKLSRQNKMLLSLIGSIILLILIYFIFGIKLF